VYTQPYDFPNDDGIGKNTDIFTYTKKANYVIRIFVSSNIGDKDKDFDSICNILVNDKIYMRLTAVYNRRVNEFDGEVYEVEGEYDYGK